MRQRNTLCFAPTSKTCIKTCIYTYIYTHGEVSTPTAISLARTLIFMIITSTVWLWDLILIMQPSMTLVMAVVHFWNCTHLNGYHFTVDVPGCDFALACSNVQESMCYCRWRLIVDSRRQARNYTQWAGVWSIIIHSRSLATSCQFENFCIWWKRSVQVATDVFRLMWRGSRF